jgi:hypothetical protein
MGEENRVQVTFPQFRGHPIRPSPSSLRTQPGSHRQGSKGGASDYRISRYTRRCLVVRGGILPAAIRMVPEAGPWAPIRQRHGQPVAHGPAEHEARVPIEDHGEGEPARCRPDVGEVPGPHPIRRREPGDCGCGAPEGTDAGGLAEARRARCGDCRRVRGTRDGSPGWPSARSGRTSRGDAQAGCATRHRPPPRR